ncbi:MAG: hypothetical protein Q8910_11765 [Bacteroidota bacterium]|nr:hypothetical protein [Bacteroidota bacterium]
MIWFDLKEMERKISTDDISEKESLSYYLGIFIISSIYAMMAALVNKSPIGPTGASVALQYFLDTIIIVLGVIYAYRLNSRIDNKDFFMRFFSLSFVIFIRLIIYTICIGIILVIFLSFFIKLQDFNKDFMSFLGYLLRIIYYILIALSFKKITVLKQQKIENGN